MLGAGHLLDIASRLVQVYLLEKEKKSVASSINNKKIPYIIFNYFFYLNHSFYTSWGTGGELFFLFCSHFSVSLQFLGQHDNIPTTANPPLPPTHPAAPSTRVTQHRTSSRRGYRTPVLFTVHLVARDPREPLHTRIHSDLLAYTVAAHNP